MNAMFWCIQSLLAGAALVLMAACVDLPETSSGGSEEPDLKATIEATIQAGLPPTPTAIPSSVGKCPEGVAPAVCAISLEWGALVTRAAVAQLPLSPISITCPDATRSIIATEPQCSKDRAGQRQQGFTTGARQFTFVDEATFRADLTQRLSSGYRVAGVGCPRASEQLPLDCSAQFLVVLSNSGPDGNHAVFLLAKLGLDGAGVFGARAGLSDQGVALRGGWLDVGSAGLEAEVVARMWVAPWSP